MNKAPTVDITHPVILKDGELYFVCDEHGEIEATPQLGRGLFYRDCRFLCRYAVRIGGERPLRLMHSAAEGFIAHFEFTNPLIDGAKQHIAEHGLAISRQQTVHDDRCMIDDRLALRNGTLEALEIELRLVFAARFEDIFALRGAEPQKRGRLRGPVWQEGVLRFQYDGADGVRRGLDVAVSPNASADRVEEQGVELLLPLHLAPQQTVEVQVRLKVTEAAGELPSPGILPVQHELLAPRGAHVAQHWLGGYARVRGDHAALVRGRVALAEVQGYAYLAKQLVAQLYDRIGDSNRAEQLEAQAEALRERFNRDFWMADASCYCLGLDGEGRQIDVIASNPGQVLWTGIADREKARATADRLMAADMFTGWGIRTLSERERRFNPFGYHTGGVWPFDNSLICAGFRRYGFDDLVVKLFDALLEAAGHFEYGRLPEFFAGTARRGAAGPARSPRADPLQAWSAGALPYMLVSLLGLEANGFGPRLRVVRPSLPTRVDRVDLKNLRFGDADIDLCFERSAGRIAVSIPRCEGRCELELAKARLR